MKGAGYARHGNGSGLEQTSWQNDPFGDSSAAGRPEETRPQSVLLSPIIKFIASADELVQKEMEILAEKYYRKNFGLEQIAHELHRYALSVGFQAIMSAHQLFTGNVFTISGRPVDLGVILVDLRPVIGSEVGRPYDPQEESVR